jgi:hypothetical protein
MMSQAPKDTAIQVCVAGWRKTPDECPDHVVDLHCAGASGAAINAH